jgi:hypothetical protein
MFGDSIDSKTIIRNLTSPASPSTQKHGAGADEALMIVPRILLRIKMTNCGSSHPTMTALRYGY